MTKYLPEDRERFDRLFDLALADTMEKFNLSMDEVLKGKQRNRTHARGWLVGVLIELGWSNNLIAQAFGQSHTCVKHWRDYLVRKHRKADMRAAAKQVLRQL